MTFPPPKAPPRQKENKYRVIATKSWTNPSECADWLNRYCNENDCELVGIDGAYYIFKTNTKLNQFQVKTN